MKKVVFISPHSWQSKRLGGFHKFAEASCESGIETVFFSFPRPYYAMFMHEELYNKKSIKELVKGVDYKVGGGILHNVTFPTLRLPNGFGKILPEKIMNGLLKASFSSFKKFSKKWLEGTDVFVFESADGIVYIDRLKKMYPNSKFVYRPSDVMMYDGSLPRFAKMERHIMEEADLSLFVHPEYEQFYSSRIPEFYKKVKFDVISNGVDIEPFEQKYEKPEALKKEKTALYVGAWQADWNLLFETAAKRIEYNFVIVCPNKPKDSILEQLKNYQNIEYVPGIMPNEIPKWMTNCDVFIVPYAKEVRTNRGLGVTAKYYQAMAAKRPIVAYNEISKVAEIGIPVTYNQEDFLSELDIAMKTPKINYNFDLESRRWSKIKTSFINKLETLCKEALL